jgi:hypothetical protein
MRERLRVVRMTDRIRTAPDVNFRPAGAGMQHLWLCMGCGKSRP